MLLFSALKATVLLWCMMNASCKPSNTHMYVRHQQIKTEAWPRWSYSITTVNMIHYLNSVDAAEMSVDVDSLTSVSHNSNVWISPACPQSWTTNFDSGQQRARHWSLPSEWEPTDKIWLKNESSFTDVSYSNREGERVWRARNGMKDRKQTWSHVLNEKQIEIWRSRADKWRQDRNRDTDRQIQSELCQWKREEEMRKVRMSSPPPLVFYRSALLLSNQRADLHQRLASFFHNKEPRGYSARKLHLRKYWQDQPPTHTHTLSLTHTFKLVLKIYDSEQFPDKKTEIHSKNPKSVLGRSSLKTLVQFCIQLPS